MGLDHKLRDRTSGAVITLYWSGRGEAGRRKQRFGALAASSWKADRIAQDTWHLGQHVTLVMVTEELERILSPSDKAIVVFPHGSKGKTSDGASLMSVHTYNL